MIEPCYDTAHTAHWNPRPAHSISWDRRLWDTKRFWSGLSRRWSFSTLRTTFWMSGHVFNTYSSSSFDSAWFSNGIPMIWHSKETESVGSVIRSMDPWKWLLGKNTEIAKQNSDQFVHFPRRFSPHGKWRDPRFESRYLHSLSPDSMKSLLFGHKTMQDGTSSMSRY